MTSDDEPSGSVLVIDDDENIRVVLARQIQRLGYQVLQASDGQSGLALVAEHRPQVIVLDLRMPGIDGHTFLRRLTASGFGASVIAMSGQGNMEDLIDVLRAGVVDYLRKPWTVSELSGALERSFQRLRERGLFPRTAADTPAPQAPPPERAKADPFPQFLSRLRSGELPIPAASGVVMTLRSEVKRPDVNLDELVTVIEQDQRLTADVLRLANTAHYARGSRIHGIRVAVSRIGFRQLHSLVETVFLRDFFKARDAEVGKLLGQLWQRSVAHAVGMREVAGAVEPAARLDGDTAYFIGLMSDVGASLLLWLADERLAAGVTTASPASHLAGIVSSHQEVGAALLGRWMMDEAVIEAVGQHHPRPDAPLNDYGRAMVVAADLARTVPDMPADLTARAPAAPSLVLRCQAELGLDRRRLVALAANFRERYRETIDACP
jgi:HD-like signal output (HDOD) protein/DNA-binding NarL/FixJ family response regulator